MSIDPSKFHPVNVTDTCSVWNILSSDTLYSKAESAGCSFCITGFVKYELLDKPRKKVCAGDEELKERLMKAQAGGKFQIHPCTIDDLQAIAALEQRRSLGKGELSSIAFAKRIHQGFLSDDDKAFSFAKNEGVTAAQTVPHLFSWLIFQKLLTDQEAHAAIGEHVAMKRSLHDRLQAAREHSLQCLQNT